MTAPSWKRLAAWPGLVSLIALVAFTLPARGQYDPNWANHIRIGGLVGFNIKADFAVAGLVNTVATGNPNGPNYVFDDGYVKVDQLGDANGQTSYWGYDHASQYSAASGELFMHSSSSLSIGNASGSAEDGPFPGFEIVYGANFWYWKQLRVGWEAGFGLLPISMKASQYEAASTQQSTYSFDTGGIVVPTPPPYQGGPSGIGPTISDTAHYVGTTNISGAGKVSEKLDVILYTLRLGPSVYWDFNRHLGMSVSAGPALGIVSGDLTYEQTFSTAHRSGRISDTAVVYGGYVNTSLYCHVIRNGDVYVSAQYMPLGNATIGGGATHARLKLDGGIYVSAGVNWPF